MNNTRVALNLIDRDYNAPVGYKEITCYLIFNGKIDLTMKARYVAEWDLTNPLLPMNYVSVASRDSANLS